jgi:hypothetical protein
MMCRESVRHDTISSYISGSTDGARMLVVTLTMITMSVMGLHVLEFQHRSVCHNEPLYAEILEVVASVAFTFTMCIPGGKHYVATVHAMMQSEDFAERLLDLSSELKDDMDDSVDHTASPHAAGEDKSEDKTITLPDDVLKGNEMSKDDVEKPMQQVDELAKVEAGEMQPLLQDKPRKFQEERPDLLDALSTATRKRNRKFLTGVERESMSRSTGGQSQDELQDEMQRTKDWLRMRSLQTMLLINTPHDYLADGHLWYCPDFMTIYFVNKLHGVGLFVWAILMSAANVIMIVSVYEGKGQPYGSMTAAIILLVLGWIGFVSFFLIGQLVINKHPKLTDPSTDDPQLQQLALQKGYIEIYLAKDEDSSYTDIRNLFRLSITMEMVCVLLILASTLMTSIGRMYAACA